ncbi:MAG: HU family DNA-binding protein [Candidatus Diapherotrites archaeon]|nr:HU family DNA-binding protein [Candidatus Diapherotrites archaeon]
MNKGELVEYVSKKTCTKKEAADAVDAVIDGIKTGLKKNGEVKLIGLGTFSVRKVQARKGFNPQTGQSMKIAAHRRVKFKAGSELKGMFK